MKKILLSIAALLLPMGAMAGDPVSVNRSSYIAGTQTSGYIAAEYLDKVVIGEATSGGNIMLYSSTWTANTLISSMSLATAQTHDFGNLRVKGIYYVVDTPTNGLTILYKN